MKKAIIKLQNEREWLIKAIKTKTEKQDPYDIVAMTEKLRSLDASIYYLKNVAE